MAGFRLGDRVWALTFRRAVLLEGLASSATPRNFAGLFPVIVGLAVSTALLPHASCLCNSAEGGRLKKESEHDEN